MYLIAVLLNAISTLKATTWLPWSCRRASK